MTKHKKEPRGIDWRVVPRRKFLLKLSYIGTEYCGNAFQPICGTTGLHVPTVEGELVKAMETLKIIRDRQEAEFSRCGRTDRGVHASGNYFSVVLRVLPESLISRQDSDAFSQNLIDSSNDVFALKNMDYVKLFNKLLPPSIRVHLARQVTMGFDARFACLWRSYEYFFPLNQFSPEQGRGLDLMNQGAQLFVGLHDFRNFCKMDFPNVHNFKRRITKFTVGRCRFDPSIGVASIWGHAFLWHQVRCMMAVLLLVGSGDEDKDVVTALLDVSKNDRKPHYELAPAEGLVLKDCHYGFPEEANAKLQEEEIKAVEVPSDGLYQGLLEAKKVELAVLRTISCRRPADPQAEWFVVDSTKPWWLKRTAKHKSLLSRAREPSFDERIEIENKKKRRTE